MDHIAVKTLHAEYTSKPSICDSMPDFVSLLHLEAKARPETPLKLYKDCSQEHFTHSDMSTVGFWHLNFSIDFPLLMISR